MGKRSLKLFEVRQPVVSFEQQVKKRKWLSDWTESFVTKKKKKKKKREREKTNMLV